MTGTQKASHLKGDRLFVKGQPFENFKVIEEVGSGANGVVYRATNEFLQREEAIKVWRSLKPDDPRDKLEQGLREAQKLASAHADHAVAIYAARQIGGVFVATMEYVQGHTLEWHRLNSEPFIRCQLARLYLEAIIQTSTASSRHGDAHEKNVLVYDASTKYEKMLKLKLCDFGTSLYSGKEASEQRHWRIVRETILRLTQDIAHADQCRDCLTRDWPQAQQLAMDAYEWRERGKAFTDFDIARFWAGPLIDYTRDLFDLNFRIPHSTNS
jgi:serine/threonine protein kinase